MRSLGTAKKKILAGERTAVMMMFGLPEIKSGINCCLNWKNSLRGGLRIN